MSTQAEVETYRQYIEELIDRIAAAFEGLTDEQVNWDPPIHDTNSLFIIANHALRCARSYVLGIVCEMDVGRDRPAEFVASGGASDIEQLAHGIKYEIDDALKGMDPELLNHHSTPAKELWGEGEPREVSGRWLLAHMVQHLSIHLGEIHLTRDWALLEVS